MERKFAARERNSKSDIMIRGILPSSMIDWPGRITTTVFFGRCNFRCPYCHNAELVLNPDSYETISPEAVVSYLRSRKEWVSSVVITGGEPTLSGGLKGLVLLLKESGFDVKIDTNGSRPSILRDLIRENLVDFIAMDVKTNFEDYPQAVRAPVNVMAIVESANLIIKKAPEYEFRTTLVPGIIGKKMLEDMVRRLSDMEAKSIVFQQFKSENALDEEFRNLKPFSIEEVNSLVDIASKYLEVEVRGI